MEQREQGGGFWRLLWEGEGAGEGLRRWRGSGRSEGVWRFGWVLDGSLGGLSAWDYEEARLDLLFCQVKLFLKVSKMLVDIGIMESSRKLIHRFLISQHRHNLRRIRTPLTLPLNHRSRTSSTFHGRLKLPSLRLISIHFSIRLLSTEFLLRRDHRIMHNHSPRFPCLLQYVYIH